MSSLVEVRVPKPPDGQTGPAYRRLARVEGSFAIVNAAAVVDGGPAARSRSAASTARPIVVDVDLTWMAA